MGCGCLADHLAAGQHVDWAGDTAGISCRCFPASFDSASHRGILEQRAVFCGADHRRLSFCGSGGRGGGAAHPAVQHAVGLLHIKAAARARLGQPLGGQHLVGGIHRVDADSLLGGHRAAARQRGAGRALPGADLIGQGGIQLLVQGGLCARVQFYHGKPFLLAP